MIQASAAAQGLGPVAGGGGREGEWYLAEARRAEPHDATSLGLQTTALRLHNPPYAVQSEAALMQETDARLGEERRRRREAERSLRESEARLRRIFDHSHDAILVIDPEADRILEANPRACELLGYDAEELMAAVRVSAVHPQEMPRLRAFASQVFARGSGWTDELSCTTRCGERVPSEISASVISLEGRDCIVAIVRDVTERRAAEDALRRSEERFRAFVENAGDGFFLVDGAGVIQDVNRRACRMLGYPASELIGRGVLEVDVGLNPESFAEIRDQLAFDRPYVLESRHRRGDGSSFPSEVSLCKFGTPQDLHYVALVRDVTERKAGEAAIARLAELGQVAAMITHQIRNPLATINLCLDYFGRQDLAERARQRVTLAREEAARLERLLGEILGYARDQSLSLAEVELGGLLQRLEPALRALPGVGDRDLRIRAAGSAGQVRADPDALAQAICNLVANACEAVAPGAPVTVTRRDDVAGEAAVIEVHNGGEPIPADILAQIGTPFFTTKRGGTGLGVAYVRRIAACHGWRFELSSSAREGTRARLVLPLAGSGAAL
jgi:PAS domain S-box-containing protein